jgi:hypothetical protein
MQSTTNNYFEENIQTSLECAQKHTSETTAAMLVLEVATI